MKMLVFDVYGGINGAANAWGIEYLSLRRFMEGGSMSLPAAAKIVERTALPYDELFEHHAQPKGTKK